MLPPIDADGFARKRVAQTTQRNAKKKTYVFYVVKILRGPLCLLSESLCNLFLCVRSALPLGLPRICAIYLRSRFSELRSACICEKHLILICVNLCEVKSFPLHFFSLPLKEQLTSEKQIMESKAYSFYLDRVNNLKNELKVFDKRFSVLLMTRLTTFAGFIGMLVWYTQRPDASFILIASFLFLAVFLVIVKTDLNQVRRQRLLQNRLRVNENELKFLEYDYSEFSDGREFSYLNPNLSADFDLFGAGSVYQFISRSVTKNGALQMAQKLCTWSMDVRKIKIQQEGIQELSTKNEFMESFQAKGLLISESGNEQNFLLQWLNEEDERISRMKPWLIGYPLLVGILVILVATGFIAANFLWLPVFVSTILIVRKKRVLDAAHNKLGKSARTFEKYSDLIALLEKESFESDYLIDLKSRLNGRYESAGNSLKKLFKLLETFDYRYNIIAALLFNLLFLFDLQVYYRLMVWKQQHKQYVGHWFEVLNETDALVGFARFSFNNREETCWPVLVDDQFGFSAMEMGHPLIQNAERVTNDFQAFGRPKVLVVTGANMAGKSTFLRTMAVNLVLAMNGSAVCARSFKYSPCHIMSSINIRDSLSKHASYFYAELLRLNEIIEHIASQPQTLVVLDEILRGTNTRDKQAGSVGLLEKLMKMDAFVMIATHDLSIGELEKYYPEVVSNYCFEVELEGDELIFDYKLKEGISKKLNASLLMKKMGII